MFWQKKAAADEEGFYDTGLEAAAVQPGKIQVTRINGQKIVVTRYDGQLYAYHSQCPHAAADMSKGEVSRFKAICPDHGYCFDVRNGRILWPEDEPLRLKTYPVKVQDGRVLIKRA